MYTLINLLDICCWRFLFLRFFRLCHNLGGPGKTALLLWVLWAEWECCAEFDAWMFHLVGN